MERRFEVRKAELLADSEVRPEVLEGVLRRLETFAEPFVACLHRPEQRWHAGSYLEGLVSDVERKNAEAIAYRQDEERQGLQTFLGTAPWDHTPLLEELGRQVGQQLGESDGVIVFDPSAFVKRGTHSVGVARQWCGRWGKVENCQVGVFMGYVSRVEQALVDMRLYLPEEWAKDRKRRRECGVPKGVRYQTRHQLALEMLAEQGPRLPHGWIAGDDEMGRPTWFRRELASRRERYLLAVPSNTTIRDLQAAIPPGKRKQPFQQVHVWCAALSAEAWSEVEVRDGSKGPLRAAIAKTRVIAKIDRRVSHEEETLVMVRWIDEEGRLRHDAYLSNAPCQTPVAEFARVVKAAYRIEQCLERSKSEAGLADYQVRTWLGWHHHVTLSLLATWFLVVETRRGKKMDARPDRPPSPQASGPTAAPCLAVRSARPHPPRMHALAATQRTGETVPLQGP